MDKEMQIDSELEQDITASSFIFSSPNIVSSPEKISSFSSQYDNVFGGRSTNVFEPSAFTFAKPATIEAQDDAVDTKLNSLKCLKESNKIQRSSPFTAKDIKKTTAFSQLEKNSKRIEDIRLNISASITCSDVPDALLVKSVAKEYFEQFGDILKITIRPRRKMITVYYPTKDIARIAFLKSGSFLGHDFKKEWTTSDMLLKPKKKETVKGKIASFLNLDDDVKEELEALKGLEYNLPDPQNLKVLNAAAKAKVRKAKVVANKEIVANKRPIVAKSNTKLIKSRILPDKLIPKPEVANQKIIIPSASLEELQSQVRQVGTTSEEKYKILDARDRLMRLKQGKQKSLATAKVTKGTCPDMCPEKERYMREFQRQLATYEQMESADYKINHWAAVKQYSRSSADQEEPMSHDLRPVKSLKMTMSYLLHEIADICEDDDANLTEWYHFLWDRMRSIRKDITQQELCCIETVELVEQCARFHILSSERLCAEEAAVFDPKINSENLTKCLQTLKYMYHDLRENDISCKNEPEFRAYIILLNLNNGTFISDLSTLPPSVQHSPQMKFALDVYSAIAMDNYCRFFKLVRKTTYLNGCILLRYFNQVRVKALSVMVKAYCRTSGTTEYPLYELIDILGFEDEEEVFDFCSHVGLKCDKESLYIKLNKESFHRPENNMEQGRAYNLVLSKRMSVNQTAGQCIAGGNWPEKTYENHKPHSSFDSQGYLLPSSINAQDQNLVDSYEFIDDDVEFVSEQKGTQSIKRSLVNTEDKQSNARASTSGTEFIFKSKPEKSESTYTLGKILPMSTSSTLNTTDTKIFAPVTNASKVTFAKPASLPFSVIPTKPSPMPINSPFSMTVNKSIFSGPSQNIFKAPATPSSNLTLDRKNVMVKRADDSSPDRSTAKRRLEDLEVSVEKKCLTDREELRRKQIEAEQRLKAEQERLKRLEKLHERTTQEYKQLEKETIEEMCMSIVDAELERIKLIETLSSNILEGVCREICESVLDNQLFIQDMLIEVGRRLRDRLILKYYRIWKLRASKRRTHRREALDNTPVWLQPESVAECARKLYRPEQKVAIRYAREKKRKSLVEEEVKKTKHAPIPFIIYVGLKENAKSLDVESSPHVFWKMVISWPLLENRLTLWRHKKTINKYLSPEDYTLEPIIIRHKPNLHESLDICIRHFEGLICENCLTGMDALLFVVGSDEDTRSIERRLTKSVLSREKLMPIPLVVIVFGNDKEDPTKVRVKPAVERLLESGYVSEYTVLYERSVDEDVVLRVIESATLWLAINRSPAVPLEMDYLKRIFDDCITEELWLRIQSHLSHNQRYSKAMDNPNFIIDLHNEAVNHVMDIMLDLESMSYTDFAPELKIYLSKKREYPCTYEFFDSVWKHPEYRAELERVMSSFILPPWKNDWPIIDMVKLHDAIVNYCYDVLPPDNGLSITSNIMSDLFLLAGPSEDNCPSFANVVIHIVDKKLSDIGGNTRVVYNRNHIKHFQTLPWWFKSSILMDYTPQQDDSSYTYENFIVKQQLDIITTSTSQMDLDLECDIDELSKTFNEQEEEYPLRDLLRETRIHVSDVQTVAEKLEKQLEQQRLKNENLEARLKEALKDDVMHTNF